MKLFCRAHQQNKGFSCSSPTPFPRTPCSFPQKPSGLLPLRKGLASETEGVSYVKSDSRSLPAVPTDNGRHTRLHIAEGTVFCWHIHTCVFFIGTTWVVKDTTQTSPRTVQHSALWRIFFHPQPRDVPERGCAVAAVYF